MNKIDLSIIIINFNTINLTIDCIESAIANLNNINYELIIINNYPSGHDYEILKNRYKNTNNILILKTENHGFGSANNFGAKRAQGDYLLFLNSDTKIIDNSIEKMVNFFKGHQEIGALNPLLYYPDNTLQKYTFGDFQTLASVVFRTPKGGDLEKNKIFFYRDRITGAAMMVKRNNFESIKGFDEKFFMYFEDEDLCRRFQNKGFKNAVLCQTKIIHLEGKSISSNRNRKAMYYQSQNYYWLKHRGWFLTSIMRFLRFPYIILRKIQKQI